MSEPPEFDPNKPLALTGIVQSAAENAADSAAIRAVLQKAGWGQESAEKPSSTASSPTSFLERIGLTKEQLAEQQQQLVAQSAARPDWVPPATPLPPPARGEPMQEKPSSTASSPTSFMERVGKTKEQLAQELDQLVAENAARPDWVPPATPLPPNETPPESVKGV